jgi:hypothetical protein
LPSPKKRAVRLLPQARIEMRGTTGKALLRAQLKVGMQVLVSGTDAPGAPFPARQIVVLATDTQATDKVEVPGKSAVPATETSKVETEHDLQLARTSTQDIGDLHPVLEPLLGHTLGIRAALLHE